MDDLIKQDIYYGFLEAHFYKTKKDFVTWNHHGYWKSSICWGIEEMEKHYLSQVKEFFINNNVWMFIVLFSGPCLGNQ